MCGGKGGCEMLAMVVTTPLHWVFEMRRSCSRGDDADDANVCSSRTSVETRHKLAVQPGVSVFQSLFDACSSSTDCVKCKCCCAGLSLVVASAEESASRQLSATCTSQARTNQVVRNGISGAESGPKDVIRAP